MTTTIPVDWLIAAAFRSSCSSRRGLWRDPAGDEQAGGRADDGDHDRRRHAQPGPATQQPAGDRAAVAELLAAGESDRVEFKSTARVNLHTGAKDDRMELVIAKTVCGFLNGDGGTLLVGVDDAGTPLGLEADYATLKAPDADRYELFLRDLLSTTLGQNAAAAVGIEFTTMTDAAGEPVVCRLTCEPSPRPVYRRSGKGAGPELLVRTGNSTRQLSVDEATSYVMHRWPLGLGATVAAQFRAAVRFSEQR